MFKDLAISLSFANICLSKTWLRFFYRPRFDMKYFPTSNSFKALIINELLFTLCIWGSIKLLRRFNNKMVLKAAKIFVCIMVLAFIISVGNSLPNINDKIFHIVLLTIIIVLLWRRAMFKATMALILLLAPFALYILGEAAQEIHREHPENISVISRPVSAQKSDGPRVLWLIFDEMDYRIAFVDRPQSIKLPEFDRFKSQSLFAENAYSPGGSTIPSIPALLSGKLITSSQSSGSDLLYVTFKGSNDKVNWGSQPTVFTRAKKLGVNTALSGEYIPYSRLIGHHLDYCAWSAYRYQYVSSKDTVWDNLTNQLYAFFHGLTLYYQQHKIATREIFDDAQRLAVDSRYGLVFIHFPIPHPPFIYQHAWWDQFLKGYADNLVLCDQILGRIRKDMELKGVWENTAIIISSDHSYGKAKKFDGKEDRRIPFMVKLANQEEAIIYQPEFNTVLTHDLVLDILSKKVATHREMIDWLDSHIMSNVVNPSSGF
jgi:hypothetical protein